MNMRVLIITIFILLSSLALAADFQLGKVEIRESYTYIELYYGIEGELQPFSEIINQEEIKSEQVKVRLLGEFSADTNQELVDYYAKHMPKELNEALESSGNLHNPSLVPLIQNFTKALRNTNFFKSIELELNKKGFSVTEIDFEKYTIESKNPPRIWVADIWLIAKKNA